MKCRIGVDDNDSYENLASFVDLVSRGGRTQSGTIVNHFTIHARKALLYDASFSTADNRRIPPLKYDYVYRLAGQFPHLRFTLNGAVDTYEQISAHLSRGAHGVMLGRVVSRNPWLLSEVDSRFFGVRNRCLARREVIYRYCDYVDAMLQERRWTKRQMVVPLVPLFAGKPNAGRRFRQAIERGLLDDKKKRRRPGDRDNWEGSALDILEEAMKGLADDDDEREKLLDERPSPQHPSSLSSLSLSE